MPVPSQLRLLTSAAIVLGAIAGCSGSQSSSNAFNSRSAAFGALPARNVNSATGDRNEMNMGRADRLSVLTFNMQHRNNPDQLGVVAERLGSDLHETPDFILCQEVLFERSRNPEEANTAALLANDLDCYWRGTKRTSDREGLAIISRYPFEYYAERHLKSQTSALLAGFRRVSVMGEFQVPDVGLVRVVNVHFTNWGFEKHVRMKQLEESLEWLAEREKQVRADLVIFGGDFNAPPGGDELDLVLQGKIAPQFDFHDFNTTAPTRGGSGNFKKRVDYIFIATPHHQVAASGSAETRLWVNGLTSPIHRSRFWPSDHAPVLHEYAVRGSALVSGQSSRSDNIAN